MRASLILASREFVRYFSTPLAYVFIVIFLSISGAFTFYIGHFFENNEADLTAFFSYLPWLYLFLVPACSMRLWAEERKTGTIIQLMTLPITVLQAVIGKFLAAFGIIFISLFLTFPLWLTVNYLGEPDNGIILSSYIVSLLMASGYLAISSCISAASKSQVISFILSALVCFLFTMSGLDLVLGFFKSFASDGIVELIASLSFLDHFDTVTRGVIRLNDIIYFISIIGIWLFANVIIVEIKTKQAGFFTESANKSKMTFLFFFLSLILFILINIISNNLFKSYRLDLTEKKVFSLSSSTKEVLSSIDEPIHLKLFYSPKLGEANPNYKNYYTRVKNLLEEYQKLSNNRLKITYINPVPFSQNEDLAISLGMQGVPIIGTEENAYFGLYASNSVDERKTVSFFALSREPYIEYDITNIIYNLIYNNKKIIALIGDTNICGTYQDERQYEPWIILSYLKEFYDVRCISEEDIYEPKDLRNYGAILLVHPKILSEKSIYAIDQYLLSGGKSIFFVDPLPQAKLETQMPSFDSLEPSQTYGLLENIGITFNSDKIVADINSARKIENEEGGRTRLLDDVTLLSIGQNNFDENSNLFSGIDRLFISTAGILRRNEQSAVNFYPLIISSPKSMLLPAADLRHKIDTGYLLNTYAPSGKGEIIAALVNGSIKSMFKNAPSSVKNYKHLNHSTSPMTSIAIADIDMLSDRIWIKRSSFFGTELRQPLANNADFILNILDSLTGSVSLTSLRGKGTFSRPFTLLEQKQKSAQIKYREKAAELNKRIAEIDLAIKELRSVNSVNPEALLTAKDKFELKNKQSELLSLKKELRKINLSLEAEISSLESVLKFINIAGIPLIILLTFTGMRLKKEIKQFKIKKIMPLNLHFNQKLLSLFLFIILLIFLAYFSFILNSPSNEESLINKKVYPSLLSEINDISKIEVTDNQGKIIINKKNNLWQLENFNNYPVSSALIRGFLLDLSELTYFEPKTRLYSRLRFLYLKNPTEPDSKSVNFKLYNDKKEVIADFLSGDIRNNLYLNEPGIYIKKSAEDLSWLAKGRFFRGNSDKYSWIGKILFDFPLKDIESLEIYNESSSKNPLTFIHNDESGFLFTLKGLKADEEIKDTRITTNIVKNFAGLIFEETRKADSKILSSTPIFKTKLTLKSQMSIEGTYYKLNKGEIWGKFSIFGISEDNPQKLEITRRTSDWLYKINETAIDALKVSKKNLIKKLTQN